MTQNGVTDGDRTRDNQCHKLALYQLNYGHHNIFWSGKRGSNSRHSAWKADALPTELLPQYFIMVGVAGFEPATPCSQGRCATELRYTPLFSSGAQTRNRTTDTGIFSPLLYRLSYLGKNGGSDETRTRDILRDRQAL